MSFITKRERVFNEYDVFDLPNRNEGKLKAYSSCTDARAWSHFCSDKSEHLVDIIKKNNSVCRPKYVPTETIISTLMVSKNAKIAALQRKIEEFEEMMAAYDQLELNCDQKCEIAKAHADIREAYKDLNGFYNLDLDLSQFTDGSEGFETGKSRGDEGDQHQLEDLTPQSKGDERYYPKEPMLDASNQVELTRLCSASTMATDPRIQEMHDTIVAKDAKMAAMNNSMAVMENDVCEPYCIYAHIYTALVKIFGILCQNEKYKLYLNLMTSGRDTTCIDIKGKILFKLKVLEKFSLALISPCSQEPKNNPCTCYRAEFQPRIETSYALTSAESVQPRLDSKRAQLVADIMENEEMKEILSKENASLKGELELDEYEIDNYNIDAENLKRLKSLQENFDDLMTCYDNVKQEKESLQTRCYKYEELQKEYEALKIQLNEYSMLWNEKEHYRRRSVDLDSLKEQYLVLSEETSNIEIQLKAEAEINDIKSKTIDELRQENLLLEKKVNDASMEFDKEKNYLQCKLKESECKAMCQDQQIRSLSVQIDRLLEQDSDKGQREGDNLALQDEINKLNEQITNLKAVCICNDEGKQQIQEEFQANLINSLKTEIEELKSGCEEILQRNDFLEKNAENDRNEIERLDRDVKDKSNALDNLMSVLQRKSQEVNRLMSDMEQRNKENGELFSRVQHLQESYNRSLTALDNEKLQALKQLQLARQESEDLIEIVKSHDALALKQDELESTLHAKNEEYNNLKSLLTETEHLNLKLLSSRDSNHSILLQELEELRAASRLTENEKNRYKQSVELSKNESKILKEKLEMFEHLSDELENLKNTHETLEREKARLQNVIDNRCFEAEALYSELSTIKAAYDKLLADKNILQSDFDNQNDQFKKISNDLKAKINENKELMRHLSKYEEEHKIATSNISSLKEENYSTKSNFTALKKESAELLEKVKCYEALELEYNTLKKEHDQICQEKNELQRELYQQASDLKRIERENRDLNRQSNELLSEGEILETALINARSKLIENSNYPENPHAEIIKEIEGIKKENLNQHKRISELLDKLDESENVIANLYETIGARDDKIAVLQNYINELKDEVQRLHQNLEAVIETGEQISDNSSRKLNESLLSIDAHHSRATHNMKIDIAKLQSANSRLEESLSTTIMRNEESFKKDRHKYMSHINELLHEREIIVADIKQLELKSVGDTELSPDKCDVEDILTSLERIGRILEVKSSKSNLLEQTLLNVQNSYQLVQAKTDEAKKIVEKEKQKIIHEKEEAIKDKMNMEKQLQQLNKQLKQQKTRDENVIKDLEAEILNQKLITDKVNQSTQSFIDKLKDELKSLETLYKNSLKTIDELENRIKSEQSNNLAVTQRISKDLENKIKEVEHLNKLLNKVQNRPKEDFGIQTTPTSSHHVENQTDEEIKYTVTDKTYLKEKKYDEVSENIYGAPLNKKWDQKKSSSNNEDKKFNEVKVLTANVEPSFDFVKNCYLDYKLKRLSQGRLELFSTSGNEELSIDIDENFSQSDSKQQAYSKSYSKSQSLKVIDLYSKNSVHTDSSKGNEFTDNNDIANNMQSSNKSDAFTMAKRRNNEFPTVNKKKKQYKNSDQYGSTSEESTGRDLFVIYKDSESSPDKSYETKRGWKLNGKSEIIVESVTIQPSENVGSEIKEYTNNNQRRKIANVNDDLFMDVDEEEYEEDDSVKHKLKISLPRVGTDSQSIGVSDTDKKSLDSYSTALFSSPKAYSSSNDYKDSHLKSYGDKNKTASTHSIPRAERQYKDKTNVTREQMEMLVYKTDFNKNERTKSPFKELTGGESHHKLSRVEADVLLLKSEDDQTDLLDSNSSKKQKSQNYGLNYILDSHKYPDNIKTYIAAKGLRKTQSDDLLFSSPERSKDASPSRLGELKKSSTDNKTISDYSNTRQKSFTERSIMVKLVTVEDYENKIQALTKTLENIEKDYKKKIDAIKMQYDTNIKSILNEHNQGVESIQSLHEETLQDILKIHENEVENLRTMSIEAMRKADKLEKENKSLIKKFVDSCSCLDEEPIKISTTELKHKKRCRGIDSKNLTKTNIEAFNVKPNDKLHGPCTCTLDLKISDTIRNIFEQVDSDQKKLAEHSYLKYIANKMMTGNVDVLDTQELSFLHLKVCRIWKNKLTKEESLQKRIDSLEEELMSKQKHTQQNIAELDRKVAEERRRLQEVREAVCRGAVTSDHIYTQSSSLPPITAEQEFHSCPARFDTCDQSSVGDLAQIPCGLRPKRTRNEINRAVLAKLDSVDRREKRIYTDELPTRLRKSHDRERHSRSKK